MPGYLFQIAATTTAGSRTDGPRLRPSVRSRSPIADYDQRLARTDWDAIAGANLANEPGQGPRDDSIVTGDTAEPGVLGRPQPQRAPAQLRSSVIELAHPVPVVDRPATTSTDPAEVVTSHGVRGYRQPSTEPADLEPAAAILDQPKQPVPVSTPIKEPTAMKRKRSALRPEPTAPSPSAAEPTSDPRSAAPSQAMIPGALRATATPATVAGRSHPAAPGEEPSGERVQPPRTAPRERTMPTAAMRRHGARGRVNDVGEMRSAAGPRVIIDRLEIEIVPPPPVSVRKPGAGAEVGLKREVLKIGPLSDPLAAGRALSLRYR